MKKVPSRTTSSLLLCTIRKLLSELQISSSLVHFLFLVLLRFVYTEDQLILQDLVPSHDFFSKNVSIKSIEMISSSLELLFKFKFQCFYQYSWTKHEWKCKKRLKEILLENKLQVTVSNSRTFPSFPSQTLWHRTLRVSGKVSTLHPRRHFYKNVCVLRLP